MRIFKFFTQVRDSVILAVCIILSFTLLIFNDSEQVSPVRDIAISTVGKIGEMVYQVNSYFRLSEKNQDLRKENARLAFHNAQLQDALLENIRLRQMLQFRNESELNLSAAEVIGKNPLSILNALVLNAGTEQGIKNSATVLTSEGLVGKIINPGSNKSLCQILLDRNSRVSAKIQRNRELGVIAWDGKYNLNLLYIAKTIKVLVGDVIVTSGYSEIYPPNIKIGVVIDVSLETDGLFQHITVKPAVNFNRLEEVFIVTDWDLDGVRE